VANADVLSSFRFLPNPFTDQLCPIKTDSSYRKRSLARSNRVSITPSFTPGPQPFLELKGHNISHNKNDPQIYRQLLDSSIHQGMRFGGEQFAFGQAAPVRNLHAFPIWFTVSII
jgi:hypothetical protein